MDWEDELRAVSYLSATRYSSLAAVVILVYDYLLCLGDEIKHVWKGRWNRGKVIYILNRYVPTFNLLIQVHTYLNHSLSQSFCRNWFFVDLALSWLGLCFVEYLLTLRTLAIYDKTPSVKLTIASLAVATMIAAAILAGFIGSSIQVVDTPSFIKPWISGCLYSESTNFNLIGGVFICPLIFESAVCIVTLKKALQHWRTSTLLYNPLVKTLYYDGFLYFFVIFAIAITNLLVWYLVPAALGMLLIMVYRVSMCVMASRIILHIRKAGAELGAGQSLAFRSVLAWAVGDEVIQMVPHPCADIDEVDRPP